MGVQPGTVLLCAAAAGAATFCIVQDRVTAEGARQYVTLQEAASVSRSTPVAIDDVMRPAVQRGVRQGALSGGVVFAVGAAAAVALRRGSGRG